MGVDLENYMDNASYFCIWNPLHDSLEAQGVGEVWTERIRNYFDEKNLSTFYKKWELSVGGDTDQDMLILTSELLLQ